MENSGVARSAITTVDDAIAKISLIHGAMYQYNNGDRDLDLLITIIERYHELSGETATITGGTPQQMRDVRKKLKYITDGIVNSRTELIAAGIIPPHTFEAH